MRTGFSMSASSRRSYSGPAFLSYGFRPFFFLGALYSGLSVLLWMPQFYGELELSTRFTPVDWHIHELYFGFLTAIVTGFLFTAVPNWTGRMPVSGSPLLLLVVLWLAGRLAVTFSVVTGWLPAMLIDAGFMLAVALMIAAEIIAGKNWRNLKILLPVLLLVAANVLLPVRCRCNFCNAACYGRLDGKPRPPCYGRGAWRGGGAAIHSPRPVGRGSHLG